MGKKNHSDASDSDSQHKSVKKTESKTRYEKKPSTTTADDQPLGDEGKFNGTEWEWALENDITLRVSKFRGVTYVDIRHLWEGKPTKKGAHLKLETFKKLMKWSKLDEALSSLK